MLYQDKNDVFLLSIPARFERDFIDHMGIMSSFEGNVTGTDNTTFILFNSWNIYVFLILLCCGNERAFFGVLLSCHFAN